MNQLPPISDRDLRRATLCQLLHWLAAGRVHPEGLAEVYLEAIERLNPQLNAYVGLSAGLLREQARAAQHRRRDGVLGRLDGLPVAIKDNFDVAGWPTRAGLPGRAQPAQGDAHAVARLRASGAVLLGKTNMDEGALGASTDNPHTGPTHNPHRHAAGRRARLGSAPARTGRGLRGHAGCGAGLSGGAASAGMSPPW